MRQEFLELCELCGSISICLKIRIVLQDFTLQEVDQPYIYIYTVYLYKSLMVDSTPALALQSSG